MPQILFIELKKSTMQKKNRRWENRRLGFLKSDLKAMEYTLNNMSGNMRDETTLVNNQDIDIELQYVNHNQGYVSANGK